MKNSILKIIAILVVCVIFYGGVLPYWASLHSDLLKLFTTAIFVVSTPQILMYLYKEILKIIKLKKKK